MDLWCFVRIFILWRARRSASPVVSTSHTRGSCPTASGGVHAQHDCVDTSFTRERLPPAPARRFASSCTSDSAATSSMPPPTTPGKPSEANRKPAHGFVSHRRLTTRSCSLAPAQKCQEIRVGTCLCVTVWGRATLSSYSKGSVALSLHAGPDTSHDTPVARLLLLACRCPCVLAMPARGRVEKPPPRTGT